MIRVLVLPLLQIPSGHQHVADSIIAHLEQDPKFTCEKVELLSYYHVHLEKLVTGLYIKTINLMPGFYSYLYKIVSAERIGRKKFYVYEWLFLNKMNQLLREKNPDLVICTHSFPSYLINRLKETNRWSGKTINVYTDFFINNHWGIHRIDYHFVPTPEMKEQLLRLGVDNKRIFVTGIPVHPHLQQSRSKNKTAKPVVLISSGSTGCGELKNLLKRLKPEGQFHYKVLCGKNKSLYQYVRSLNNPLIEPLPYISSKDILNRLYDEATFILTKPGGVTLAECLYKNIPVIIYQALPGQEEYNLQYFLKKDLIYQLSNWERANNIEKELSDYFRFKNQRFKERYVHFLNQLEKTSLPELIEKIIG